MTEENGWTTRRDFMTALGAAGISLFGNVDVRAADGQGVAAKAEMDARRRIDVHHHILPPELTFDLLAPSSPLGREPQAEPCQHGTLLHR